MQLGMIGVGRMGGSMVRRLIEAGHELIVHDTDTETVRGLVSRGARGAGTLRELAGLLSRPRAIWMMVPAAAVDDVIDDITPLLDGGDILVDGGNSDYHDDIRRAAALRDKDLHYLDVGVSGGVWGLERGYCQMIGGDGSAVEYLDPVFAALAPGVDAAQRTPGRAGAPAREEQGYLHCGPSGAGHFVKMVHNGIEYGLMAAYAEGLNILKHADVGVRVEGEGSAETTPLREPDHYRYHIDLPAVAEVWRRGAVIGSWLLDLTAAALQDDPELDGFHGRVSDSGEGRWTVQAAVDEGVPAPVIAAALFDRFASRGNDEFANKLLSAMRYQFGGHEERNAEAQGEA
ncbi:MAG: decarboxylating 6-phosphogluconate dehydrogenase [Gammaproteobacteria bacterium]|jgi:6-phosphogluconate dehydrogenase